MGTVRIFACFLASAAMLAAQTSKAGDKVRQQYLANPNFHWKCDALAKLDLCYPAGMDRADIGRVVRDFGLSMAAELRFAGVTDYAPRVHVFVVESAPRMQQLMGAYANGSSEPREHVVCVVEGYPEVLTHELNHDVMTHLWGPSEPWIAEGVAAYVAAPQQVDGVFRLLLVRHTNLRLERLVNPRWTAAAQYPSNVIYPELGSFVKYLFDTYGLDRLREVWQHGSEAIPRIFGKPVSALEKDWRAAVTRNAAPH